MVQLVLMLSLLTHKVAVPFDLGFYVKYPTYCDSSTASLLPDQSLDTFLGSFPDMLRTNPVL